LKQQYFWTAASLADMMRRFKNLDKPISEFSDCKPSHIDHHESNLVVIMRD
jgi:Carbohydrate phosphorylase